MSNQSIISRKKGEDVRGTIVHQNPNYIYVVTPDREEVTVSTLDVTGITHVDTDRDSKELAGDIFAALADGFIANLYAEGSHIRSAPGTDSVDVLKDGQWYRISVTPVDQPITEEAHGAD